MDDERIERALREGRPNDGAYEPSGRWLEIAERRVQESPRRWGGLRLQRASLVAIAAVAATLVLVLVGGRLLELRQTGVGGLVSEIERRGAIRVALDGGPPQVFLPTGGYQGFDTDLARAMADRLGVRLDLVIVPRAEILSADSHGGWDVAISSIPRSAPLGPSARTTAPYAEVRGAIAVRADDAATTPDDLAGTTLCVVDGSVAAAWGAGTLDPGSVAAVIPVPRLVRLTMRATAEECLTDLQDGTARGIVLDRRADLTGRPGLRFLSAAPYTAQLVAIIDARADGNATLITRLNNIFEALAADGTIRDISQRRLAGEDATPGG